MTGSVPGMPQQTGQVAELGGSPNCVLHPQNSFVCVRSCTWTSSPITMRYGCSIWHSPELTTESQRAQRAHRERPKKEKTETTKHTKHTKHTKERENRFFPFRV